jgi:hypothetical protein
MTQKAAPAGARTPGRGLGPTPPKQERDPWHRMPHPRPPGAYTPRPAAEIVLYLDYSAADVLHAKVAELCAELRAEATA